MTTQLDFPEPRQRKDWSKQATRLYAYVLSLPNVDIPQPELNRAAAGRNGWVNSFTKRVSEVRRKIQSQGGDFILSRDEWKDGQRRTWYRYIKSRND